MAQLRQSWWLYQRKLEEQNWDEQQDDDPSSRCHQPQAAITFVSSIVSQPAGTLVDLVLSINFRRLKEMGLY